MRCLGTQSANLYTGDYSVAGLYERKVFVVERKGSVAEFAGNLCHKEKWDDFRQELERLEEFEHPFIICEFDFEAVAAFPSGSGIPRSKWKTLRVSPAFLMRRVLEIQLAYKTPIIFAGSRGRELFSSLCKRVTELCPP